VSGLADRYHLEAVMKIAHVWPAPTGARCSILSHADRWNLPLFKRLHNCILASLSETEDYTGILLFGKSERDLLQQSKGFSACDEEELDVFVAVGTPFSGLIDGTASEPW
jgi:hypothetical protein